MNNPSRDMSFLDHLEELRWHIIRSTISVLIVAVIAFLAKDIIFDQIIFGPKKGNFISYQIFCSISQSIGGDAFCFEGCRTDHAAEPACELWELLGWSHVQGRRRHNTTTHTKKPTPPPATRGHRGRTRAAGGIRASNRFT